MLVISSSSLGDLLCRVETVIVGVILGGNDAHKVLGKGLASNEPNLVEGAIIINYSKKPELHKEPARLEVYLQWGFLLTLILLDLAIWPPTLFALMLMQNTPQMSWF